MKKYTEYKYIDFLEDDSFIRAQSGKDNAEKTFWSELVDRHEVDIDEYLEAGMLVETWHNAQPDVDDKRLERLKAKIELKAASLLTNSTERDDKVTMGRNVVIVLTAVAASVALFLCVKHFTKVEDMLQKQPIDYASYRLINEQHPKNEILIVKDNKELKITGENPDVRYDEAGTLTVNDRVIPETKVFTSDPAEKEQRKQSDDKTQTEMSSLNRLYVPFGKRATLTLSDGSLLWVNTGTMIVYPETFNGEVREIYVNGEIYAEIKKDENKPFTVKTDVMDISVIGTEFNLSAYDRDNFRQIVLVKGSVCVKHNDNNLNLVPNQAFTTNNSGEIVEIVDTEVYTAWKDGFLLCDGEPIERILVRLARYYNVTMFLPQKPSETAFYGKLELKENIENIMRSLSDIASFNYIIKDGQYTVQYRQ